MLWVEGLSCYGLKDCDATVEGLDVMVEGLDVMVEGV